jgi:hypothetical protein
VNFRFKGEPPTERDHTKSLCETCRSAVLLHGHGESEQLHYCQWLERPLTFKVARCSRYKSELEMTVHEMQDIAWILRPDENRQKYGFHPPERKRDD